MVNQDATHKLCRNGEKVSAIFEAHPFIVHEPQVRLVHESCGLQRDLLPLASHIVPGEPAQFAINDRGELLQSALVTIAPRLEQKSDFFFRRWIASESHSAVDL